MVKAHNTIIIGIKYSLPKQLRNGNFIAKPFCPFSSYLPLIFMLQFKKGKSYLKIANPNSKGLIIKAGTALGCVSFELIRELSQCANNITHLHQDMDGSSAMCSMSISDFPINHLLGVDPDIAHSHAAYLSNEAQSNKFCDNQHEIMMRDYYSHNQDKMTPAQIRELKVKTLPYLRDDDVTLFLFDRNIVRKELDLDTDSVLSDTHKHSIRDCFYSMHEC